MLQHSTYSVISPEGCATILWKSAEKASEAAEIMGITAGRLKGLGLIDQVVEETPGGAHRDVIGMARNLKQALETALARVKDLDQEALVRRRIDRLMAYGAYETVNA